MIAKRRPIIVFEDDEIPTVTNPVLPLPYLKRSLDTRPVGTFASFTVARSQARKRKVRLEGEPRRIKKQSCREAVYRAIITFLFLLTCVLRLLPLLTVGGRNKI
jgi:hypothetical protein